MALDIHNIRHREAIISLVREVRKHQEEIARLRRQVGKLSCRIDGLEKTNE